MAGVHLLSSRAESLPGPLLSADGEVPHYFQLYVHDPALETTNLYNNMTIPQNMLEQEKLVLLEVLEVIQGTLHEVNPFVQDCKQIMEMSDEEIANGKIIICAKAPSRQHARRYNVQANLKEVSILADSQPHDLILQKREGGLHCVSDLHLKGMPLHFTLLFPFRTSGCDLDVRGRLEVTATEESHFHIPYQYPKWCQQGLSTSGWMTVPGMALHGLVPH